MSGAGKTGVSKVLKPAGEQIDAFEKSVSQALLELEMNSDLGARLRQLFITGAKEVEVGDGKKAIVIFVPPPQLKSFQKIQIRLVGELEKKFPGRDVVFLAKRKILPKETRKTRKMQKRPRSRTLTSVYDAALEDLIYPAEIVGKRIRVRLDGSRIIKVHLDKSQEHTVEDKVDTFSVVYKKLTGKQVSFEFHESCICKGEKDKRKKMHDDDRIVAAADGVDLNDRKDPAALWIDLNDGNVGAAFGVGLNDGTDDVEW